MMMLGIVDVSHFTMDDDVTLDSYLDLGMFISIYII